VMAGNEPTEPKVPTVVSEALRRLRERPTDTPGPLGGNGTSTAEGPPGGAAEPNRVVLFLDLDGVVHRQGDSRIDDRGALVGAQMFRWWPLLAGVLEEYPKVDVVVHSSWRRFWPSVKFLAALLPPALSARVVDITDPDVIERHRSIEVYLDVHPDVSAFVILDDQPLHFPKNYPPLVVCDPMVGVSDAAVLLRLRQALEAAARVSR